jgi:hypothetical protein
VGGNECGLDFDKNGPCRMDGETSTARFRSCEVAKEASTFLIFMGGRIRVYPSGQASGMSLEAWEDRVSDARERAGAR